MNKIFNKVINSISKDKSKQENISENTKQEMLESLKWMEDFDLYTIDMSDLWESTVSMDGDTMMFKKWVVKKDNIWNYIIINWQKCREYRPGITGFVYKNIKDRYHYGEWLEIWFCNEWEFVKSIIIQDSWHPKECESFPREMSEMLWWPLYEIDEDASVFYVNKSKKWELTTFDKISKDIMRSDIYKLENEIESNNHSDNILYKDWIAWKDENGEYLSLDGVKFYKFSPGITGLVYSEFLSAWLKEPSIFLAEYKDGKIVWEGVVLSPKKKQLIRK